MSFNGYKNEASWHAAMLLGYDEVLGSRLMGTSGEVEGGESARAYVEASPALAAKVYYPSGGTRRAEIDWPAVAVSVRRYYDTVLSKPGGLDAVLAQPEWTE